MRQQPGATGWRTPFPEHDMGERVARLVNGQLLDYTQVGDDFALARIRSPADYLGISFGQCDLRRKHGITIVAVERPEQEMTYATTDTELADGDVVIICGRAEQVDRFTERA
ncbi:TrkA C-terminal domain-containing protein [Nonomuraea rosea]|uniref:TrkA C-terminal domain-containing protein n=1 Tax=Nonomuraea rosea TaxID=638574 RepID=UPI0031EAC162